MREALLAPLPPDAPWPFAWAAPSFVMPGTVAENVRFMAGTAPEVALCLFETKGTLAYTKADLPAPGEGRGPQGKPLRYHAHLPVDLPWQEGRTVAEAAKAACDAALAVLGVVEGLAPRLCVLHPPLLGAGRDAALLAAFLERWQAACGLPVLLENIGGAPLVDLPRDLFARGAFGVCIDAGHLMGYHQEALLDTGLPGMASLVHWSAPGGLDRHRPLAELTDTERATARRLMALLPSGITQLVEIFAWQGVTSSLPVLAGLWAEAGRAGGAGGAEPGREPS